MSLFFASLNSGSNGNCYYIGNHADAILVDAGISCRETEKRMLRLALPMSRIRAIFISHEHSDHISGLCTLAKKYQLPVYISSKTLLNCPFKLESHLVKILKADEPVTLGSLRVHAFPKIHDAHDPHSFMISAGNVNVGVFTDIGSVCKQLQSHFGRCHAAFLEANFDDTMLENGRYPNFLKNRIRGGRGHLSNNQALELFRSLKPSFMSHLVLAHLSKDNNCPHLVQQLFSRDAGDVQIIVASRYSESHLYQTVSDTDSQVMPPPTPGLQPIQTSLF